MIYQEKMCFIIKYLILFPSRLFLKKYQQTMNIKLACRVYKYQASGNVHYNIVDFSIIFDGMIEGMLSEYKAWQEKEWKMCRKK